MPSFFSLFVRILEIHVREGDQVGLYKRLETMNMCKESETAAWRTSKTRTVYSWGTLDSSANDGPDGSTRLYATSPKLVPNIAKDIDQWPETMPPGVQPTMQELADAICALANGTAVGPDGVSVELFKVALNGDPVRRRRLLDIAIGIWRGLGGGGGGGGSS